MGGAGLDELQRIGLKLFAFDGTAVRPRELVPVFHRWIQQRALSDQLLIDIADYEHVPDGPGVLLVAHEGNFSLDLGGGRMGLAYNRKAAGHGALLDRLSGVARTTLEACRLLEDEPSLGGRLRFRGDELHVFANDRLRAPNTPEIAAAFGGIVQQFARKLYGDVACAVTAEADPRERLGAHVKAPQAVGLNQLIARVG